MSRLRTLMDAHALARKAEDVGAELMAVRHDIGRHFNRHAHLDVSGGLYDTARIQLDEAAEALSVLTVTLQSAYIALHEEGKDE